MDVRKLIQAAKYLENIEPNLSKEILKTAQNLSDTNVNTPTPQVVSENPVVDPQNLNPNTKNYGDLQGEVGEPQRDNHKITFDIDVPPGFSKTDLVNHLMNALNSHPEIKQNHIEVTGYSFRS